jgi:hypothetical protein
MDLETLVSSSCRRKILKALLHSGRTNVMELVRKVNSTYNQVNLNLHLLQKANQQKRLVPATFGFKIATKRIIQSYTGAGFSLLQET